MNFYNLQKINRKNATYNIIFGERSNGKTYALLKRGFKTTVKTVHKWRMLGAGKKI